VIGTKFTASSWKPVQACVATYLQGTQVDVFIIFDVLNFRQKSGSIHVCLTTV